MGATIIISIICIISSCSLTLLTEAKNSDKINNIIGFSADVIHRDSPISPLYDPNSSSRKTYQRRDAALLRRHLQSSSNDGHIGRPDLATDGGQYLMKMSYGTPPVESFSLIDTGSSLSWIQCLPCTHCYPSESPPFNPRSSTSFEYVTDCGLVENNSSNYKSPGNNACPYNVVYLDHSYSRGDLARETIRVGSGRNTVTFRKFLFGCGHENVGHTHPHKSAGLVGFGLEEHSFISQLHEYIGGRFSHCFAPATSSRPGKISFGSDATISGSGVVSTPLIIADDHYYITLEGVTVGTTRLDYVPPAAANNKSSTNTTGSKNGGLILLDTGAEGILVPEGLHVQIDVLVQKQIHLRPTSHLPFTLCYPSASLRDSEIPKITFHFDGANLELGPANTFLVREDKRCLSIVPRHDIILFGNVGMINFLVAYDFQHHTVSFKPTDCSRS